jgi:hypothetical protein
MRGHSNPLYSKERELPRQADPELRRRRSITGFIKSRQIDPKELKTKMIYEDLLIFDERLALSCRDYNAALELGADKEMLPTAYRYLKQEPISIKTKILQEELQRNISSDPDYPGHSTEVLETLHQFLKEGVEEMKAELVDDYEYTVLLKDINDEKVVGGMFNYCFDVKTPDGVEHLCGVRASALGIEPLEPSKLFKI